VDLPGNGTELVPQEELGHWQMTRSNNDEQIAAWIEEIWNYHRLNQQLEKSDAVLVLCSHDKLVAEYAARLFLDDWAPLLIFSGGLGSITRSLWSEPEADQFARIAVHLGVPKERILIENKSSNTGENVLFTKKLLAYKGLSPHSFILVQKPYMERRSFATFKKFWPEKPVVVTSPQVSFAEYLGRYSNPSLSRDDVINIMVGDLQRIWLYPKKDFQIEQEIPGSVWLAYRHLVKAGYDKHLLTEE